MGSMCETRKGQVTVPNTPGQAKLQHALAEATQDAISQLGDNEKLIPESVRTDGPAFAQRGNDALMNFNYVCTVMVPGCTGWSTPAT
jgi:hypothetical protein